MTAFHVDAAGRRPSSEQFCKAIIKELCAAFNSKAASSHET